MTLGNMRFHSRRVVQDRCANIGALSETMHRQAEPTVPPQRRKRTSDVQRLRANVRHAS
jgi:hypothetical protein